MPGHTNDHVINDGQVIKKSKIPDMCCACGRENLQVEADQAECSCGIITYLEPVRDPSKVRLRVVE
jgi:hypothetical protein